MWHNRSIEDSMLELGGTFDGLTSKQAMEKLAKEGPNQLDKGKRRSLLLRMILQLKDPMIFILLVAAGLSYMASGGEDWVDACIILLIVLVNNIVAISQEDHAHKALEALQEMSSSSATVLRDGKEMEIHPSDLVTGDIMILRTGDKIPSDGRLIHVVSLQLDESAMTGESHPVEKRLCNSLPKDVAMAEWTNMVLSGTLVTGGHGKALVVATGMDTQMGKIAKLLQKQPTQISPLQEKMGEVSKTLSFLCLSVCAVMFGIGLIQGADMLSMFMTAVALAVAAIPEGLPAVVSIVLALGMSRMAERGAIVKKLSAVETLGCASVICSDKTGTLTQNKMTVQDYYTIPGTDPIHGLQCAMLCSNAQVTWEQGSFAVRGSPTESALALYAANQGINRNKLWETLPKIEEIPFDSQRKLMSTIHPNPEGGYLVYTKGAPDILVKLCTHSQHGALSGKYRQEILEQNEAMARKGMRIIAVAQRTLAFLPSKLQGEWVEQGLTFLGLLGISDPPRPEAKEAVALCHKAGVRPVMITGDHRSTAIAIAKELDIYREGDWAVTGQELDFMPQAVLEHDIEHFTVFARVSPEHKMRIVNAWQNRGKVVAVTGDGVNDAPALKTADIGCAMGIAGTDVAKGASEMILTTDNFHTIVHAIEEGRGIYANIKKAIHYLLSCNIGEIITIFVGTVLHLTTMPLIPVQLLWLNLVTDTLPALALGVEEVEEGVMTQRPRGRSASLFDKPFSHRLLWQGLMVGLLTLGAYGLGYFYLAPLDADELGRGAIANTMAFATLTLTQLFHGFNVRSETKSLFQIGFFSNASMNRAFLLGMALQLSVLCFPPLQAVFSVIPMNQEQWMVVFALAFSPIPFCEVVKWMQRRKRVKGKRVVTAKEFRKIREAEAVREVAQKQYAQSGNVLTMEELRLKQFQTEEKNPPLDELQPDFSMEFADKLSLDDLHAQFLGNGKRNAYDHPKPKDNVENNENNHPQYLQDSPYEQESQSFFSKFTKSSPKSSPQSEPNPYPDTQKKKSSQKETIPLSPPEIQDVDIPKPPESKKQWLRDFSQKYPQDHAHEQGKIQEPPSQENVKITGKLLELSIPEEPEENGSRRNRKNREKTCSSKQQ